MSDRGPDRILLEVISCSVEDARNAEAGGADRLEVTEQLDHEGLTPSLELVERIRQAVSIPMHVMLRSRNAFAGYSPKELDRMHEELRAFRRVGVDGVVVGFLTRNAKIDFESMEAILKEAQGLSITFHRAFDHVRDHRRGLEGLIERNVVHRVLTSGGASSALEGRKVLADLFRLAGGRIALIAGGGVSAENLPFIFNYTGVREYHTGRSVRTPPARDGVVDAAKVRHLTTIAQRLSDYALPTTTEEQ